MHKGKKMYENADAFLCLPGGIGTLEEVSETITDQLNISGNNLFLNINGFGIIPGTFKTIRFSEFSDVIF